MQGWRVAESAGGWAALVGADSGEAGVLPLLSPALLQKSGTEARSHHSPGGCWTVNTQLLL